MWELISYTILRSSNTLHQQFYKHCVDEAPLHTPLPIQVRCASAVLCFQIGNINLKSPTLDYPRVEDNLWTTCVDDSCQPQFVSEMKHGIGGGQHFCPKGKVHLSRSFLSKVVGIISPRICHPYLSEEVLPHGRSSAAMEQPHAKSSASELPLQRLKSPCALCNDSSFRLCHNLSVHTTSSIGRKKRRDDESFLNWFSCWTNSKSLGYNSSRHEDILRAFSNKIKATAILNKKHRK